MSGKRLPTALVKRANDQLTAERAISNGKHSGPTPDAGVAEEMRLGSHAIVVRLSDVQPERVSWLAPGFLPLGKVVLLEGDPGTSKSTLTLDIAARITRGECVLDAAPMEPQNVVLVTFEDGLADTVRPRVDALGGDPARVFVFRGVTIGDDGDEREPTFPDDAAHLHTIITDRNAALVVVDPLGAALGEGTDSHKDASVRRVMSRLHRLAEETGACVLCVRHLVKGSAPNALRAGGGSIAFIAAARVAWLVSLHPDDAEKAQHERRRVLACVKNNLSPHSPSRMFELWQPDGHEHPRIRWLGESPLSADDLNAAHAASQPEERDAGAERSAWLREILADGPVAAREVFKQGREMGYNERSLRRTAKAIGVRSHREGSGAGHRSMWELGTPVTPVTPARQQNVSEVSGVKAGEVDVAL